MGECCMADYESLLRDKELGNKLRDKKKCILDKYSFRNFQKPLHKLIALYILDHLIFRSNASMEIMIKRTLSGCVKNLYQQKFYCAGTYSSIIPIPKKKTV